MSVAYVAILTLQDELVVGANGEVKEVLGRCEKELVGYELSDLFPVECVKFLRKVRSGGELPRVTWMRLEEESPGSPESPALEGAIVAGGDLPTNHWFLVLRHEPSLRESDLDALPAALLILRPVLDANRRPVDFIVRTANLGACALFGHEKQGLLGRTLSEALPDFEKEWLSRIEKVWRTGEPERFVGQSEIFAGRYFDISLLLTQKADVACSICEQTELIEREEQLGAAVARLEHVLESSPIILHVLRYDESYGDFVPVWISPNVEQVLGYTVEEALQPQWWTEIMNPEDREIVTKRSREVFAKGQLQLEYRVRTKWGREVWIQDFARVTLVHDERPVEVLVTWTDITRRVINEELLKEQIRQHRTMRELGLSFAGELTPEGVARAAVRKCAEIVEATLAWIGVKEIDGTIRPLTCWPEQHPFFEGLQVRWDNTPLSKGPTGRAVVSGQPHNFPDFAVDPSVEPWRPRLQQSNIRSGLAIPLIYKDRVLGNVTLYSNKSGHFVGWRERVLEEVSPFIAAELSAQLAYAVAEQRLAQLEGLRRIDLQIISEPRPELVMDQVLREAIAGLGVDAAAFVTISKEGRARVLCCMGFRKFPPEEFPLLHGGIRHRAVETKSRVILESIPHAGKEFALGEFWLSQGFVWYCGQPIMTHDRVLGLLELYSRRVLHPSSEWFALLETLAGQGAIGLELAWHVEKVVRQGEELRLAYEATLHGWVKALEMRDRETEGHSQRVTSITLKMARLSGVPEEQLPHIERGALLHDLGKIGIPDSILCKPGPLTEEEWAIMRQHPTLAKRMLEEIEFLRPAIDIPYCHHEKWDGTGYPRGLAGEAIPWAARLFAVVDVWDALMSDRPYRKAWSRDETLSYLSTQSGSHFDPRAVDLFFQVMRSEGA